MTANAKSLMLPALLLICCPAVLWAQGNSPTTSPTTQAADLLKGVVDPYDAAGERVKFFKATGVESEMTEAMFNADAKAGGNFVRPFDSWRTLVLFDKNGNGKIDWFEADAYRQALRAKVLEMFDKKKAGSLSVADRQVANAFLATGKPVLTVGKSVWVNGPGFGSKIDMVSYIEYSMDGKLTDDQKKKLADIQTARDKAESDFDKDNGPKLQAASAAYNDACARKDNDAIAKTGKEYMELVKLRQEAFNKSQADMAAVLTDEQKTQWGRKYVTSMAKSFWGTVDLSDEQIEKVRKACGDDVIRGDKLPYCDVLGKVKEVMTPEQRAAGEKHFAMGAVRSTYYSANLTDEQVKQAEAAWEELAKGKTFTWQTQAEAMGKLLEKVKATLTDEQKETMRKKQEEARKAFEQMRNGQ